MKLHQCLYISLFLCFIISHVHVIFLNNSAPQNVNVHTLRALCTHLYETRPLLVSLPPRTVQNLQSIPFVHLGSLRPDTLVHALLRVKHTRMISGNSLTSHTQTYSVHYYTNSTGLFRSHHYVDLAGFMLEMIYVSLSNYSTLQILIIWISLVLWSKVSYLHKLHHYKILYCPVVLFFVGVKFEKGWQNYLQTHRQAMFYKVLPASQSSSRMDGRWMIHQ